MARLIFLTSHCDMASEYLGNLRGNMAVGDDKLEENPCKKVH